MGSYCYFQVFHIRFVFQSIISFNATHHHDENSVDIHK